MRRLPLKPDRVVSVYVSWHHHQSPFHQPRCKCCLCDDIRLNSLSVRTCEESRARHRCCLGPFHTRCSCQKGFECASVQAGSVNETRRASASFSNHVSMWAVNDTSVHLRVAKEDMTYSILQLKHINTHHTSQ